MLETKYLSNPEDYKDIVLFHKKNGKLSIGETYKYRTNDPKINAMSLLYHNTLPAGNDVILAWNDLDRYGNDMYAAPEESMRIGVEDFLASHTNEISANSVECREVNSFADISKSLIHNPVKEGKTVAFAFRA